MGLVNVYSRVTVRRGYGSVRLCSAVGYCRQLCDALIPDIPSTLRNVTLWRDYFLRWSAKPSCPSSAVYDLYPRKVAVTTSGDATPTYTTLPPARRTVKPHFRRSFLFNMVRG